ncbi:peptidylprolyl isomerase [Novosphingobium sp. FSY-8]|uniref:peptidylprolyl isomerase n=1 Tax=Novosphingobium ovatum TaxID=1908523 RepID=A0ABW9XGY1_9SPHN|nr:peptidylprolyl isomerase [Novosphingobium ovatum]NBC37815.1 peptidylprolyl isomerase [Novosphingobium ovatum]
MRKFLWLAAAALLIPPHARAAPPPPAPKTRSAAQIIKDAPDSDWVTIAPDDLLVMTLAPDAAGQPRRVVIQLLPAPFSQGWIGNIRRLATAHWWDNTAVYRVQDNFVAQFGDPDEDTPHAKPLPPGLAVMPESAYAARLPITTLSALTTRRITTETFDTTALFLNGWPMATARDIRENFIVDARTGKPLPPSTHQNVWPTHCYGTIGVGRNNSPDTGTGAELYAVIGTPPRQLDRNIAVVGRVIAGIEHLSSLPRGPAPMGMYGDKAKNTPILSIRLASALPPAQQPRLQSLSTTSDSFRDYVSARIHRRDSFYILSPGSADICNIPVPIRPAPDLSTP